MTWAGERSKHFCSFQSPEMFFLLTLPFIERRYGKGASRYERTWSTPPSRVSLESSDAQQPHEATRPVSQAIAQNRPS